MPFDPREATIATVRDAILSGSCTCREVVQSFLVRIEALNHHVNAIICLNPDALDDADMIDQAHAIERARATQRAPRALFGVPVLLKDNFDAAGLPTTAGCLALAGNVVTHDAPVVAALRSAGAIILGKTNLHEFALEGLTVSSLGGQTINPYDATRTPGGSSGGSAAAVAMSFCVFATGTDTVNSLRNPASANSLCSLRPTPGLVSRDGIIPVSHTQDAVGPIARTVRDLAVALGVMASTRSEEAAQATPDVGDQSDVLSLSGLRLGVIDGFMNQITSTKGDPVDDALESAFDVLQAAGAKLIPIGDSIFDAEKILQTCDIQRQEYRDGLTRYLARADSHVNMSKSFDAIYSGQDFMVIPHQYRYIAQARAADASSHMSIARNIEALKQALKSNFEEHRVDAMLYPQQRSLVKKIGFPRQSERNGILAAVTGFPVVTVPVGFSLRSADAPRGVPVGMEILGRPHSEKKLLVIAHHFERLHHVRRPPKIADEVVPMRALDKVPTITPDASTVPAAYSLGTLGHWSTSGLGEHD